MTEPVCLLLSDASAPMRKKVECKTSARSRKPDVTKDRNLSYAVCLSDDFRHCVVICGDVRSPAVPYARRFGGRGTESSCGMTDVRAAGILSSRDDPVKFAQTSHTFVTFSQRTVYLRSPCHFKVDINPVYDHASSIECRQPRRGLKTRRAPYDEFY
jgi:hypothetical protein